MVGTGHKVPAPCESRMHHNQREPIQVLASLPLPTSPRPKKGLRCRQSLVTSAEMQTPNKTKFN